MQRPARQSVEELAWVHEFPVYGLGDAFVGRRWIASTGTNHLGLGHGNPLGNEEDPCLIVGFEGPPIGANGRSTIGSIDMRGTLASTLVFDVNEHRYLGKSPEEREQLTSTLMATDVRTLDWSDANIAVDGRQLRFSLADLGGGNWVAFREFPRAHVYLHAHNWPTAEQLPHITRIDDLTPYLQGREDVA